jgi:hypothetical protein
VNKETIGATRRTFLKTSAIASAGLVFAVDLRALDLRASADAESPVEFSPNAFIQIHPDNTIRVWVTRS